MNRALIAMSGGVDSSVAAKLTVDAGYDCIGCTMKLYNNEDVGLDRGHTCCSLDDVEDARSVAHRLGIKYYVFNFKRSFRELVIARFVEAYEKGITPNPCIDCNRYMKFEELYLRAKGLGFDYVVTGHYARIEFIDNKFVLKKALDESKDQSYVLYSMTQQQLAHTLFPLGNLHKAEVRRIAEESGFLNADKPDSQDICFVPNGNYVDFLKLYSEKQYEAGDFVDTEGNVIGIHNGIVNYTIGQRKGLGMAFGKPMYVKEIDAKTNRIILGVEDELYCNHLIADEFNWISGDEPHEPFRCTAKIRYRQAEQPATAEVLPDGRVDIIFDEPQRAITPGQAAVLYDGDIVLGGGRIV